MGVHHFTLIALPRSVNPENRADGGFLDSYQISAPILARLRQLLPRDKSWGDTEEFTTDDEWGSDLRFWKESDGSIFDVVFRFAPMTDNLSILQSFLEIMKDANLRVYVAKSKTVMDPDIESVLSNLKDSEAVRFIKDPERTLKEAAARVAKQED